MTENALAAKEVPQKQPLVDVFESKAAFLVHAELPGAVKESLEVSLKDSVLRIEAQATFGEENYRYLRSLRFKQALDGESVSAKLEQGLLSIELQKLAAPKARTIEVQVY